MGWLGGFAASASSGQGAGTIKIRTVRVVATGPEYASCHKNVGIHRAPFALTADAENETLAIRDALTLVRRTPYV